VVFPTFTRLSCHDFADNAMRLQLFALAYNLGNFLRQMELPKPIRHWSMTTLREKLIKIGAKVVRHARYTIFKMAEVAVSRELFSAIIDRIGQIGEMVSSRQNGRISMDSRVWRPVPAHAHSLDRQNGGSRIIMEESGIRESVRFRSPTGKSQFVQCFHIKARIPSI
jgi:hypothetical protein